MRACAGTPTWSKRWRCFSPWLSEASRRNTKKSDDPTTTIVVMIPKAPNMPNISTVRAPLRRAARRGQRKHGGRGDASTRAGGHPPRADASSRDPHSGERQVGGDVSPFLRGGGL